MSTPRLYKFVVEVASVTRWIQLSVNTNVSAVGESVLATFGAGIQNRQQFVCGEDHPFASKTVSALIDVPLFSQHAAVDRLLFKCTCR